MAKDDYRTEEDDSTPSPTTDAAGEMIQMDMALGDTPEDTEDGGAMVRLSDEVDAEMSEEHFANIVDEVDQAELTTITEDLLEKISRDKEARKKRDELYEEGIRRTGLSDDAPGGASFSGATKVVHPLLVESCVDFSARVTKELLPSSGPVKSKIIGVVGESLREKARSKTEYMNWQLMQQMKEFRSEMEQMTTQIPLGGVQYMKMYYDSRKKRPVSEFVAVDDMYLPFAASSFQSAERKTHVQYVTAMEFNKRVEDGMYRDITPLPDPDNPEYSKASLANDKIEGREEDSYNEDGLRTIFEVYTCFDVGEGHAPYILSIDKTTEKPLALYRNWEPQDEAQEELDWIVEFPFVPWRGAYPIGLTHMIGGLAAASTGALRALLDSAHINNLPTMLKLKGGPNGQTLNLAPTEVVEIEGGLNVDDVRKIAMPVPFNQPSQVLYQLLGFLTDAGRGVVQTSFEKLSDTSQQQPVGTTMALIEQGMAVFSSIHSRLHAGMSRVLQILHRINSAYLTEEDIERQLGRPIVAPGDFDGPMDIVPVSDPHIFSETQRFAQMQAVLQRAESRPQLYDTRKTEEMFLRQMKLKPEEVLIDEPGKEDRDPVSENVAATMGQPIYVLPKQDHPAHLNVHISFIQSPVFGQNPTMAPSLLPAIVTHLRDHLLNYYMTQSRKAVEKAQKEKKIQDDGSQQAMVIDRVIKGIEQQFQPIMQMLQQLSQQAQQFAQKPPEDPSLQITQINAEVQKSIQQMKAQMDQMELQFDKEKFQSEQQFKQLELQMKQQLEQQKLQQERELELHELANKQQMNTSDNRTAMRIAGEEISSKERTSYRDGTSINPNPTP